MAAVFVVIAVVLWFAMLYCPVVMTWKADLITGRRCNVQITGPVVPLGFVPPNALAFWSDGTWDRFLSKSSDPDPVNSRKHMKHALSNVA